MQTQQVKMLEPWIVSSNTTMANIRFLMTDVLPSIVKGSNRASSLLLYSVQITSQTSLHSQRSTGLSDWPMRVVFSLQFSHYISMESDYRGWYPDRTRTIRELPPSCGETLEVFLTPVHGVFTEVSWVSIEKAIMQPSEAASKPALDDSGASWPYYRMVPQSYPID